MKLFLILLFVMAIKVQLQPKQSELLDLIRNSPYTRLGFGGSNGGGKSAAIRDINLILCTDKKKKPIKTIIFRRNSNQLLENHIIPFFQKYPDLSSIFNKSERMIYWYDGSTTKFGSADNEQDVEALEGNEYDYEFIDEATHCTQYMIEYLASRNRSGNVKAKMIFTMIPGFIGHNYFKRLFITKKFTANENPADYFYLPARIWDNVVWVEDKLIADGFTVDQYYKEWNEDRRKSYTLQHSDYAQNLSHLPEQKKRARLFGDWYVFEGQFFEEFNENIHVIKRNDYLSYEELLNFNVASGLDYGNVTSLECMARDHNNNFILFDELHQEGLTRSIKIEQAKAFLKERGLLNKNIVADTNMWIKDAFDVDVSQTPAYEYINAGLKLVKVSKTSPAKNRGYREACNDTIRDLIHYEEKDGVLTKKPQLLVYERCTHFLETFPALVISSKNPDDIEDGQPDHDFDSMKYITMYLRPQKEKVVSNKPLWLQELQKENKAKVENDFMSV